MRTPAGAESVASDARSGDTGAAREILEDFVGAMKQYGSEKIWEGTHTKPIYYAYARYLADAFDRILQVSLKREREKITDEQFCNQIALALGVKSSRPGRPKGRVTHDRKALEIAYWFLIRRGHKPNRAVELLSKATGADRRTIQRASRPAGELGSAYMYTDPALIEDELLERLVRESTVWPKISALLTNDRDAATITP